MHNLSYVRERLSHQKDYDKEPTKEGLIHNKVVQGTQRIGPRNWNGFHYGSVCFEYFNYVLP